MPTKRALFFLIVLSTLVVTACQPRPGRLLSGVASRPTETAGPLPTHIVTPAPTRTPHPTITPRPTEEPLSASWTTYGAAQGLPKARIIAFAFAANGAVWGVVQAGGVVRFDGKTLTSYTDQNGLPTNVVTAILALPDGSIWLATTEGIGRFDGSEWTFYNDDPLCGAIASSIAQAPDGVIWVGMLQNGVCRFDGKKWTHYSTDEGLPSNQVWSIAVTRDGAPWAGTEEGIAHYDGTAWTTSTEAGGVELKHMMFLTAAPDGTLWVRTLLGVAHWDGAAWQPMTADQGLPSGAILDLTVAPDGAVWAVSQLNGVIYFDGHAWNQFGSPDLALQSPQCIGVGPGRDIWVGTWENGVMHYIGK